MKKTEYKEYVILGKKALSNIQDIQKKICSYAMEVITIRHGGKSEGVYTIKKYAEDIGMNPKTLQNWLQVYNNVVVKLEDPNNANWSNASKVNNCLEENRVIDNHLDGKSKSRSAYKKNVPVDRVRSLYHAYEHEKPFEGEFINIVQQAKSHRNLLQKRDLNIIQDAHLDHLESILAECSTLIKNHLTKKRNSMGRTA